MSNVIQIANNIGTFVDAGTSSLAHHTFVSENLNKRRGVPRAKLLATSAVPDVEDSEQPVHYRLNQTGNIFYATTSSELQEQTRALFESVTVLFAAMTKALADKKKGLFDYAAWESMITKSGWFVEVQKSQKNLVIKSGSVEINTQIVQQLLPGLKTGHSMDIAKDVLAAINGAYSATTVNESTKIGHLLFICEELFGAPSVTVRLFYTTKVSHKILTSSPCHKSAATSFEQLQEANTFLFVSPDTIAKFSKQFGQAQEEYQNLINQLSGHIS